METLTLTERERGIQALRQGDLHGAAGFLRGAVSADGRDAEAQAFLGIACSQTGAHEDAVRALRHAVELQPSEPRYRFNLGVALENGGETEAAAAAYREVLRLFPAHPQARAKLYALEPATAPVGGAATAPWLQSPYGLPDSTTGQPNGSPSLTPAMGVGEAFGRRFAAALIDGVITLLMMLVVGFLFGTVLVTVGGLLGGADAGPVILRLAMALNLAAGLFITWAYYVRPQGRYGQTVGKMLLGIRLIGPNRGNPGIGRVVVREIGLKFVPSYFLALLLGPLWVLGLPLFLGDCLWMLWDPNQQTWHDKIAGTRVERV